jgi:hypothetical protein
MFVAIAAVALASCSTIAPVKVSVGDQCFRCRRSIQDARLAGEVIGGSGFVAKFRAPGCMAKYLAAHPEETGTVFVTDYTTGKMVRPDTALFVPVVLDGNTGERDYRAYRVKAAADEAAIDAKTVPYDWKAVLEKGRS